jgi:hypothetical protein
MEREAIRLINNELYGNVFAVAAGEFWSFPETPGYL